MARPGESPDLPDVPGQARGVADKDQRRHISGGIDVVEELKLVVLYLVRGQRGSQLARLEQPARWCHPDRASKSTSRATGPDASVGKSRQLRLVIRRRRLGAAARRLPGRGSSTSAQTVWPIGLKAVGSGRGALGS